MSVVGQQLGLENKWQSFDHVERGHCERERHDDLRAVEGMEPVSWYALAR